MKIYKRTYYRKKRHQARLSISEVANALGIDCTKYELIDKGEVKMPKILIDKFNEIINKGKNEQTLERLSREDVVNQWWDEMAIKIGHGKYKLNEKMKEFNIDSLLELSQLLGWKTQASLSNYLNGYTPTSFNIKNKIYSFFENELNIQPPKKENKKKNILVNQNGKCILINSELYNELLNWYKTFDLKAWVNRNKLSCEEIRTYTKLSNGTISNLYNNKIETPKAETLLTLKTFVDNIENNTTIVSNKPIEQTFELTSVSIEKVPEDIQAIGEKLLEEVNENMKLKEKLIDKYQNKLEELEKTIQNFRHELQELEIQKDIYAKILEDINDENI